MSTKTFSISESSCNIYLSRYSGPVFEVSIVYRQRLALYSELTRYDAPIFWTRPRELLFPFFVVSWGRQYGRQKFLSFWMPWASTPFGSGSGHQISLFLPLQKLLHPHFYWISSTVWFIAGVIERHWSMHFPEPFGECELSAVSRTISEKPQTNLFS